MSDAVAVIDDGGVRTIRLNRPEKKNALTLAMYLEMTRALKEADAADATRCVVIASTGGTFCAGNDITDFLRADPRS
jgi:enoyl-CoA hydratase/carnithine racemase